MSESLFTVQTAQLHENPSVFSSSSAPKREESVFSLSQICLVCTKNNRQKKMQTPVERFLQNRDPCKAHAGALQENKSQG